MFLYGLLKPTIGFSIRFSSFLLFSVQSIRKRLREFEEIEYQGKAVEETMNSMQRGQLLFGFRPEFCLRIRDREY
jgi:hypothetical protein